MIALDQLRCSIYVEAPLPVEALARCLAARIQAVNEPGPIYAVLRLPTVEVEIRANEDASADSARGFPDGFVYFRYKLEVFVDPEANRGEHVPLVADVLRQCWENGWPAVAACGFEEELPERGGYKCQTIPWPGARPLNYVVPPHPVATNQLMPK